MACDELLLMRSGVKTPSTMLFLTRAPLPVTLTPIPIADPDATVLVTEKPSMVTLVTAGKLQRGWRERCPRRRVRPLAGGSQVRDRREGQDCNGPSEHLHRSPP